MGSFHSDISWMNPEKKDLISEKKRIERNSREKMRSLRISQQIDNLKDILVSSGVKVRAQFILIKIASFLTPLHHIVSPNISIA
jgi:Helix-loop-helix DNA-binding domain